LGKGGGIQSMGRRAQKNMSHSPTEDPPGREKLPFNKDRRERVGRVKEVPGKSFGGKTLNRRGSKWSHVTRNNCLGGGGPTYMVR